MNIPLEDDKGADMSEPTVNEELRRLLAMTKEEIDAEIRALGGDPQKWVERARAAIAKATGAGDAKEPLT